MDYKLIYDTKTGKLNSINRLSDNASIPICEGNTDYQEFLKWNKAQKIPLDLNSTIEVVKPEPVRDLAKEIDVLKSQVATNTSKITAIEKVK